MSVLPQEIKYSESLKPLSVEGKQASMVFLPTTSGNYSPTNNIIRFSVNSQKFLDWRNSVLRFTLTQTANTTAYLDGSASSVFQRLSVFGPSQQLINYIDNYGRLFGLLSDLEYNKITREGLQSVLQGYQSKEGGLRFTRTAANVYNIHYVAPNSSEVLIGSWDVAAAAASDVVFGDWTFRSTATANQFTVLYRGETANNLTSGTAGSISVGGCNFSTTATASEIVINGNSVVTANAVAQIPAFPNKDHSSRDGVPFIQNTAIECEVPLVCSLSLMKTYFPSFALSGQGITLELLCAAARDVFCPSVETGTSPSYSVSNVQLVIPTIEFDASVHNSFNQMMQQAGSLSMSSIGFESMIYPVSNATASVSIPLSFKKRSIKSIYVYSQSNAAQNVRTTCGRNRLRLTKFQLRNGSQYYPLQPVDSEQVALCETMRSVGKLSDIRVANVLSNYNYKVTAALGGCPVYGLDLESSPLSYLENGLNNASSGDQLYLDVQTTSNNDILAGNLYIFVQFDNTLTIVNRDLVATS